MNGIFQSVVYYRRVTQRAFGASYQPSAISHQLFVSAMPTARLGPQALGCLSWSQNRRGEQMKRRFSNTVRLRRKLSAISLQLSALVSVLRIASLG
jgi:hypothetical protein